MIFLMWHETASNRQYVLLGLLFEQFAALMQSYMPFWQIFNLKLHTILHVFIKKIFTKNRYLFNKNKENKSHMCRLIFTGL